MCQFKWMHVCVCGLAPEAVSTQLPLSKADRKQLPLTCSQYGEQRPSAGTSCHDTHQFQTNVYWARCTVQRFHLREIVHFVNVDIFKIISKIYY